MAWLGTNSSKQNCSETPVPLVLRLSTSRRPYLLPQNLANMDFWTLLLYDRVSCLRGQRRATAAGNGSDANPACLGRVLPRHSTASTTNLGLVFEVAMESSNVVDVNLIRSQAVVRLTYCPPRPQRRLRSGDFKHFNTSFMIRGSPTGVASGNVPAVRFRGPGARPRVGDGYMHVTW